MEETKNNPNLRRVLNVLNAAYRMALEYLDDIGIDTVWDRARGWLEHYEKEAEDEKTVKG